MLLTYDHATQLQVFQVTGLSAMASWIIHHASVAICNVILLE